MLVKKLVQIPPMQMKGLVSRDEWKQIAKSVVLQEYYVLLQSWDPINITRSSDNKPDLFTIRCQKARKTKKMITVISTSSDLVYRQKSIGIILGSLLVRDPSASALFFYEESSSSSDFKQSSWYMRASALSTHFKPCLFGKLFGGFWSSLVRLRRTFMYSVLTTWILYEGK